ncbi:hypothetical protein EF847_01555 [Actinobacteria bacterium YIM 96077]|uniref:Uncharacterized protein n=1 Tax=Phytoactinopolyspora halophila TaxID=1981511 RepID=A0A329QFC2_9ACTN|nr:hypothetical protein EF847_01555 [Actinobacteria bacterium YIM 96077]RAW11153.1 hypothetical protein DPM12_17580 [Phytoactinopolyspora halophila]
MIVNATHIEPGDTLLVQDANWDELMSVTSVCSQVATRRLIVETLDSSGDIGTITLQPSDPVNTYRFHGRNELASLMGCDCVYCRI